MKVPDIVISKTLSKKGFYNIYYQISFYESFQKFLIFTKITKKVYSKPNDALSYMKEYPHLNIYGRKFHSLEISKSHYNSLKIRLAQKKRVAKTRNFKNKFRPL